MKHLLLLPLVSLFSISATYAPQEPSKAETITWLQEYGRLLLLADESFPNKGYNEIYFRLNDESSAVWFHISATRSEYDFSTKKVFLANLESVKLSSENSIRFESKSEGILHQDFVDGSHTSTNKISSCKLFCKDKESAQRFYKAVKHLLSFYDYNITFEDYTQLENKF